MPDAIETAKLLRDSKLQQMRKNDSEINQLQRDNEELQCHVDALEQLLKEVSPGSPDQPARLFSKYANMSLSPAVLDMIETSARAEGGGTRLGFLVPEIIEALLAGGFESDAKELYPSVYSVAMRLVKQGKIREGKKDGKRSFMSKQPF